MMPTKYNDQGFTMESKEMIELQHKINDFMTLGGQYDVPSIVMIGMLEFAKAIIADGLLQEYNKQSKLMEQREQFMRSFDSVPKQVN